MFFANHINGSLSMPLRATTSSSPTRASLRAPSSSCGPGDAPPLVAAAVEAAAHAQEPELEKRFPARLVVDGRREVGGEGLRPGRVPGPWVPKEKSVPRLFLAAAVVDNDKDGGC